MSLESNGQDPSPSFPLFTLVPGERLLYARSITVPAGDSTSLADEAVDRGVVLVTRGAGGLRVGTSRIDLIPGTSYPFDMALAVSVDADRGSQVMLEVFAIAVDHNERNVS